MALARTKREKLRQEVNALRKAFDQAYKKLEKITMIEDREVYIEEIEESVNLPTNEHGDEQRLDDKYRPIIGKNVFNWVRIYDGKVLETDLIYDDGIWRHPYVSIDHWTSEPSNYSCVIRPKK